ncbi:hypothetical protein BD293_4611 [Roseinatronobacter monicus]|uniref:Uncharacterized protein n=1 Tax=Roseinatronobacter monicus TaxID=393481 RepID=A0A543K3G3_9RHOB|nr:hypothetical protein BD293_4611 [Roseinatronobacter monicus]
MNTEMLNGCLPALMTPCKSDHSPDHDALVRKGALVASGMSGVVYCGSMGDWQLISDADRIEGVARRVGGGVPVIVRQDIIMHVFHSFRHTVGCHSKVTL